MEPSKYKIESLKTKQESNNTHQVNTNHIMASVANFKSAVIRIRDILRGASITGMDSMRHICLYLLSRYMTTDKVSRLDVPGEFSWENFIKIMYEDAGLQKAFDYFFHPQEDCLVRHFDRIFGTDKFSFDLQKPGRIVKPGVLDPALAKHKEILEILDKVNMEEVDCQMDILGWVYEQHLNTGASTAGRDLGQFFTDRFICEYMTKLCKPGFKRVGVPESICDPAMGTGGFLTSFIKYYKKYHPDTQIDWSVQQTEIHGNDTDPKVAGLARLNLFMEMKGSPTTNLLTHDSLYDDLTQTGYDVILANMPFGLKGIIHADCCERVKDLKIRGTKSEPLFLQLMMVSLNRGGRCAVVVPEGMLNNSTSCHDGTRKYLLDNFELKRVIKMRGKFFMNTGIEPSILFFENTGNPTTEVEFWDVVKGSDGLINETMVLSVPRERFDASCSLDMRRYQEVKEVADSAGFPMVKLGDIAFGKKYPSHDTSVGKETGSSRFHTGGEYTRLYTDNPDIHDTIIIVNRTNGSGKSNIFIDSNCSVAKQTLVMSCDNTITTKYVFFWLSLNKNEIEKGYIGSNHKNLSNDFVKNMVVPLPPLPIQHKIVATLDRIYQPGTTELAETIKLTNQAMDLVLAHPNGATLEPIVEAQRLMRKSAHMVADVKAQMVADVKAQMVAIVKAIEYRGFTIVKLGDIIQKTGSGKTNSTSISNTGEYPFYGCTTVVPSGTHSSYDFDDSDYLLFAKSGGNAKNPISPSMGIGKFHHVKGRSSGNVAVYQYKIKSDKISEITYPYLTYILRMNLHKFQALAKYTTGNGNIDVNDALDVTMPLPPLDFQQAVLARLDALQAQLSSLENLGKQAEDNARFILESYLGSTLPMPTAQSSDAHTSTCKVDKDGVGCTCSTSRSQIVDEEEDEKDEKSKHLEPEVEEKASQASGGSRDLTETELAKKKVPELREIAKNLAVKSPSKMNRGELVQGILEKQAGK